MKKTILILTCLITLTFMSCEAPTPSADETMQKQTAASMSEANREIGMPGIKNFQERKLAKMIFELRDDENLICHAYLVNQMTGNVGQYLGKCVGFGLPYSVQYTNPEKPEEDQWGNYTLPQADPNGLFMPQGLSATWLMLLDDEGKPHPVYVEPSIIVSPFELKRKK